MPMNVNSLPLINVLTESNVYMNDMSPKVLPSHILVLTNPGTAMFHLRLSFVGTLLFSF